MGWAIGFACCAAMCAPALSAVDVEHIVRFSPYACCRAYPATAVSGSTAVLVGGVNGNTVGAVEDMLTLMLGVGCA